MDTVGKALATFGREAAMIAASPGTTEATFCPAVQRLVAAILDARRLPFEVLHDRLDGACEAAIADPFTGEELGV